MGHHRIDLSGKCLLIVEDDYLVASDLTAALEEYGAAVVGPAGTVDQATRLLEENAQRINAAVLDVNLRGERTFGLADTLNERHIPFVFVTGYAPDSIPAPYLRSPRCDKPVDIEQLAQLLGNLK